MNRQIGGLPKLVTFRGLVQIIQQFVFHNIFPCPVARYVAKEEGLKKTKTYAIDISKDPRSRQFVEKIRRLRKHAMSARSMLGRYNEIIAGEYKKALPVMLRPWTVGPDPEPPSRDQMVKSVRADLKVCSDIRVSLQSGGTPKIAGLDAEVQNINRGLAQCNGYLGSRAAATLDMSCIQDESKRTAAMKALDSAIEACNSILGMRSKASRETTYDKLDRLNNQILRPDIWFCAAPRCNVLFPELYQSFQWSRNFLREVTRLELQTTHEILDAEALFNGRYYAPNITDMRKGLKLSSRMFSGLILSHELLTGIIPMYEKLSEANLFAMKSEQVSYKGAKVSYAQRSVNHQYFKYRFSTRQMAADGRFNPWFVPGFPAVIIDRPMDSDKLAISGLAVDKQVQAMGLSLEKDVTPTKAMLLQQLVPNQFFGCCTGLQHSLNQQGGTTSYTFEQARIHREDTEFLGVDKAVVNKKIGTSSKKTTVAALSMPTVGSVGPRGGRISHVTDVSKKSKGRTLPALRENRRVVVGTKAVYGRKQDGKSAFAGATAVAETDTTFGTQETSSKAASNEQSTFQQMYGIGTAGSSVRTGTWGAYVVSETYVRRARVKIDLPIEEAIHPPWIWDGWRDLKIGETYQQFFGTQSITDIEPYGASREILNKADAEAQAILLKSQEGVTSGSKQKEETTDEYFERSSKEEPAPTSKNTASPEPVGPAALSQSTNDAAHFAIEKERTIENAVDYLVRVYSFIKHYGLDVGEFIRNYSWRPVANMVEIMGSAEFIILEDPDTPGTYITSGKEGFHSRAFGDVEDLFGLVDPSVKKVLGLSTDKQHATAQKLDVRKRRRQAVWAYVDEITSSRGLLG
jgi:hypothetical protein